VTHPTPSPEPPAPRSPAEPGAQEIAPAPVGATATHQLPRVEDGGVQPTGPVGGPPGPPGSAVPPLTGTTERPRVRRRTAERPRRDRTPRAQRPQRPPRSPRPPEGRAARLGTGLAALSLLLLQLGLLVGFGEAPLWSAVTLWSVFATLAALLGVLPYAGGFLPAARLGPDAAWRVAAGGLTGVAVFWVLVVLPRVDSDRGFVLTAALAALGAALWVAPSRTGS
jgi:hypothetical protein